jgi:hypothetical protein
MRMPYITSSLITLILMAGCNSSPRPDYDLVDLVQVFGKVELDGEPLPDAVVTFEAPTGQFSFAQTDANGNYTLRFDSVKYGTEPGQKVVRISTARRIVGLNVDEAAGEVDPDAPPEDAPPELIPDKYNKQSELRVEVPDDGGQFDFPLASR